mmetsp:Transcript_19567/g.48981  ORF Transcript_19567/g.48981 Transcript_19567/m.48981 type:complete len:89 (-) Transcript_19567:549-815(-)
MLDIKFSSLAFRAPLHTHTHSTHTHSTQLYMTNRCVCGIKLFFLYWGEKVLNVVVGGGGGGGGVLRETTFILCIREKNVMIYYLSIRN